MDIPDVGAIEFQALTNDEIEITSIETEEDGMLRDVIITFTFTNPVDVWTSIDLITFDLLESEVNPPSVTLPTDSVETKRFYIFTEVGADPTNP